MFQRQVMFKQMQELQRRQQLQELGDTRNQNYSNQLSSLKQSGGQFPPTINGTPVHDSSQMFMHGNNMQMMPNELVLSQPQFDPSLYRNMDKNLNQYSYYQRPSDSSGNMLTKNNNTSPFGMSYNMLDGPSVANQVFQEKNYFGQVPFQGFDGGNSSEPAAPLDPMEQKILYNTDGNNWESSFNQSSKTGGDAFSSIESGSWSALMQSALAETSSEDNGVQEEWSGLSFHNQDNQPFNFLDNEKPQSNWVDRNSQNLSSSSLKSENLFENSNTASILPGFPQSGYQNFKPKEESHYKVSQASTHLSHRNTGQSSNYNSQLRQSSPSQRIWPGHESGGNSWLNLSQFPGGMQKPFAQANQVNAISYSSKSDKMDSRNNVESMPPFIGGSLDFDGQNMATQSVSMLELLNKDDEISKDDTPGLQLNSKVSTFDELSLTENSVASLTKPSSNSVSQGFGFALGSAAPQTQQSHSFFPSLSMGNASAAFLSNHNLNDFLTHQGPVPPVQSLVSKLLDNSPTKTTHSSGQEFSIFENVPTQPSTSAQTQHVGFQQDMSSHKPNMFSSNSSSPDTTNSGAPGEQPNQGSSIQEASTETYNNQSQISLQMAPSWFKHYGKMNNPKSTNNVAQLFNSGMINGNSQDISSIMQVNSASQPAASISLASKHIPINENLVIPKKRKRVDFEMLPRRKEVNGETLGIQSTGLVETEWARPSVRTEEVISEAENVKDKVNIINCSSKSDKMDSGNNIASMSPLIGGSLDFDGQNMATQSVSMLELLNKDDEISNDDTPGLPLNSKVSTFDELSLTENSVASLTKPSSTSVTQGFGFALGSAVPQTQQSHSFFPSLSMVPVPPVQSLVSKLLDNSPTKTTQSSGQEFSIFKNVPITQPSASALTQHVGLQQEMSSHIPNMFSSNSSSPDTNSGVPGEQQPNQGSSLQEGSTETYNNQSQSQISLQMAPSWFKHNGTMNNPKSANNVAQLLNSGMITGNLQDISSIMQVNSDSHPAASISIASKHIPINENLVLPKKRRRVDFEMVPWRKEIIGETLGIQSTGLVETEWARSSNRKEEIISEAENGKDKVLPGVQAKRRLTSTTELIQQVFPPPPAEILHADASLNFDSVAYYVARLELGDVCSLTSQLPHQTRDFSKVVEGLDSRMKKLEEVLSRADNNGLSFVDFKLENQELEKISTINRFAKYHIKNNVDPASSTSSASNVPRNSAEKYVIALPMPNIVPEGVKCLSL